MKKSGLENMTASEGRKAIREIMAEAYSVSRRSEFGCPNCLWAGIECVGGAKFIREDTKTGPRCKAYTYYN